VHRLIGSLPRTSPTLPLELELKLAALGEFAVRARTQVPRDGRSKDILNVPEAESATRLPQQLAQLAKGSALIGGRDVADGEDYAIARRAALDSIPAVRRKILDALIAGREHTHFGAGLPASTFKYAKEELDALGLVDLGLTPLAEDLLRKAGIL